MLQKLVRDRIAQNTMYQGKEQRLQLVNELKAREMLKTMGSDGAAASISNASEASQSGSATSDAKANISEAEMVSVSVAFRTSILVYSNVDGSPVLCTEIGSSL